jgi:hypothetical protein
MKKSLLIWAILSGMATANTANLSTLPITSSLILPSSMDLGASRTMNTSINPKTKQTELPIFALNGGIANFSGQIVTTSLGKPELESVAKTYLPIVNSSVPGTCSFNTNGSITCFHPNSLVIEDNTILYQLQSGNTKINNKLDTGVMGSSIKFFAATEFDANNAPTKYIGISNDTYKQQLSWLNCGATTACKQNKIKLKPPASTVSAFQQVDNKLYFVVNYNTLVTIDTIKNSYSVQELNVYNVSSFALDPQGNLYVMNSIANPKENTKGSFAISKCTIENGKCEVVYTDNTTPLRYSRLFMGIDNNNIYLLANKENKSIALANNIILAVVPKNKPL